MLKMIWLENKRQRPIQGETPEELVKELWESAFDAEETVEAYMAAVAARTKIYTGKTMTFSNAEQFLSELERLGLASIEVE